MASTTSPQLPVPRTVVTQHNKDGTSTLSEQAITGKFFGDGSQSIPLWSASKSPADMTEQRSADISTGSTGSFFTAYDIPPNFDGPLHRTVTLDYVLVLKGTVGLIMDDGSSVTLREGDTVVQRGTMHKWKNEGDGWARMISVMLPAQPVVVQRRELPSVWPY